MNIKVGQTMKTYIINLTQEPTEMNPSCDIP